MKLRTKLMTILATLIFSASAFAGTVTDSANLFGPDANRLASHIENSPLYVETFVATPGANLKQYADNRVKELTSSGFLLVVTSQPREWRISMNPIGLAGSEKVRQIGSQMVQYFKHGRHAEGVAWAAKQLQLATQPTQTAVYVAPAARNEPISSSARVEPIGGSLGHEKGDSFAWVKWFFGITFVIVVIVVCVIIYRKGKRQQEEEAAEKKSETKSDTETKSEDTHPTYHYTPEEKAKAQTYYDQYSSSERTRIIHEYRNYPQYSSGILDNPFMFYWFMTTIVNNNQPRYAPEPIYQSNYTPVPPPERSSDESSSRSSRSDDDDSSSRSRSDESGGGGSWGGGSSSSDSSSSSSDSGSSGGSDFGSSDSGSSSSSDSSGGGGSW